jgi:uncharacterized protein YjbJ (UPF0337 family)
MNLNEIAGRWKQLKGLMRERWGRLTDRDLEVIRGRKDQLVGRLQELYGIAQERARREIAAFAAALMGRPAARKTRASAGRRKRPVASPSRKNRARLSSRGKGGSGAR